MKSLAESLAAFAAERAAGGANSSASAVASRIFRAKRQKQQLEAASARVRAGDRRALQRVRVRPENAQVLLPHLPETPEDHTHAVIAGDFVFCDLITAIVEKFGPPRRLRCVTLSLSLKNIKTLEDFAAVFPVEVLVSHYFERTSKEIFRHMIAAAERTAGFSVATARTHCKVTLIDYAERPLVIVGSANLRSSRNREQITIFCDSELLEFYAQEFAEAVAANREQ